MVRRCRLVAPERSFRMRCSQNSVCGSYCRHHITTTPRGSPPLIMVRMLMAGNATELLRTIVLQRGLARQVGDRHHPAEAGFGTELLDRHQPGRPVESGGCGLESG